MCVEEARKLHVQSALRDPVTSRCAGSVIFVIAAAIEKGLFWSSRWRRTVVEKYAPTNTRHPCAALCRDGCVVRRKSTARGQNLYVLQKSSQYFNVRLKKRFSLLMLCRDCNLASHRGLSVTASGGLAAARPLAFLAICRFAGRGTASTAVDSYPVIPHARVDGITSVSRKRCFGIIAQYCFRDVRLDPYLAPFFVYRITPY